LSIPLSSSRAIMMTSPLHQIGSLKNCLWNFWTLNLSSVLTMPTALYIF